MINLENVEFQYKTYEKKDGGISVLKDVFFSEYKYKKNFNNISLKIDDGSKVGFL